MVTLLHCCAVHADAHLRGTLSTLTLICERPRQRCQGLRWSITGLRLATHRAYVNLGHHAICIHAYAGVVYAVFNRWRALMDRGTIQRRP